MLDGGRIDVAEQSALSVNRFGACARLLDGMTALRCQERFLCNDVDLRLISHRSEEAPMRSGIHDLPALAANPPGAQRVTRHRRNTRHLLSPPLSRGHSHIVCSSSAQNLPWLPFVVVPCSQTDTRKLGCELPPRLLATGSYAYWTRSR